MTAETARLVAASRAQNLTVRPGYRPSEWKLEKPTMYGIPTSLTYDLALSAQNDRLNQAVYGMLVREAVDRPGRIGLAGWIRHRFGGALIALGQLVHGGRNDVSDHSTVPSPGTLRLAR